MSPAEIGSAHSILYIYIYIAINEGKGKPESYMCTWVYPHNQVYYYPEVNKFLTLIPIEGLDVLDHLLARYTIETEIILGMISYFSFIVSYVSSFGYAARRHPAGIRETRPTVYMGRGRRGNRWL